MKISRCVGDIREKICKTKFKFSANKFGCFLIWERRTNDSWENIILSVQKVAGVLKINPLSIPQSQIKDKNEFPEK